MSNIVHKRPCSSAALLQAMKNYRFIFFSIGLCLLTQTVRGQCSVSSATITADTSVFCHAPFTVSFNSTSSRDTTPVLLSTLNSVNNFQQAFTHQFPTQNNGCTYYLEMSGSAGLWLGTNRADAYAKFNGANNSPYGPPGLSNWFLNIQPISGLSAYSSAHFYQLVYNGDGSTISFGFFDNPYNDNSGLVTFKWYGVPCYQYDWDFGDGTTSNKIQPNHTYANPGTYTVKLRITDLLSNCYSEVTTTVSSITAPVADLGPDRNLCTGQTILLNANAPGTTNVWQDNSTGSNYLVTSAGTYYVTVTNECGSHIDSMTATYDSAPSFTLGPDTILCSGSSLLLAPGISDVSYTWQDNSTASTFSIATAGTYSLTLANFCGAVTDAISVDFWDAPQLSLGNDITKCEGESHLLDPSLSNVSYIWHDQSTQSTYTVNSEGTYALNVSNMCGMDNDTIEIFYLEAPSFSLPEDTYLCEGQSIVLQPMNLNTTGADHVWQDGSQDAQLIVTEAGTYSLIVENQCGSETDDISLSSRYCDCRLFTPSAFSPNNDGINDRFYAIVQCELLEFEMRVYNRYGELLFTSFDPSHSWGGDHHGKKAPMDTYSWLIKYRFELPDDVEESGMATGQLMLLK